ncbi:MAG: hypothetical protein R3C20_05630 [Planctomycetaceae bacterium]
MPVVVDPELNGSGVGRGELPRKRSNHSPRYTDAGHSAARTSDGSRQTPLDYSSNFSSRLAAAQ